VDVVSTDKKHGREMNMIKPDFQSAKEYCSALPEWAKQEVSTSPERFGFIMGVLEQYRPKVMAEIGVSVGTLSGALLYKSRQYCEAPVLYGIDLGETAYFDDRRGVGEVMRDAFPSLVEFHRLNTGKIALDSDEIIQEPIDFAYIDANHCHPWASIDMLCLLPHLADKTVVGFHDTIRGYSYAQSGLFAFQSLDAEKFEENKLDFHGSGFCILEGDREKYLDSLLLSFSLPWETGLTDEILDRIYSFVGKHFGNNWKNQFVRQLSFTSRLSDVMIDSALKRREAELNRIYNSTSWKVTAPLRLLSSLIGRS